MKTMSKTIECECCGSKENIKIRNNPLYPYFVNSVFLCEDCFSKKIIPYKQMFSIICLYKQCETIPDKVLQICLNTIKNLKNY